ncbi:MAG: pantoate--beta-alanine ligase [Candidatus Dadabacteria bacterium]
MVLFKRVEDIQKYISTQKKEGRKIGFIPTMGALHEGHLSLIQSSRKGSEITICSIFVNPTQFNNKEDFNKYPASIEQDIEKLITAGCDALFYPSLEEIYPKDYHPKHYELGNLEKILEGHFRPGHFQGVCQVVDRLLEIIQPDNLYLGQKDYQQCMVINKLLSLVNNTKVQLIISPTIREESGLAMSSRNLRLNEEEKKTATAIYQSLLFIKENLSSSSIPDLKQKCTELLTSKGFIVDYVDIVDAATLNSNASTDAPQVALIAATINNVRLIDNMLLD